VAFSVKSRTFLFLVPTFQVVDIDSWPITHLSLWVFFAVPVVGFLTVRSVRPSWEPSTFASAHMFKSTRYGIPGVSSRDVGWS